jgi:hypothetical protein
LSNRKAWQLIVLGPLCGLLPIFISFVGAAFGSNIGLVLPWATLLTFPVGIIVALFGVAAILRNSTSSGEKSGTNSKVGFVRFLFSFLFVLILVNTAIRVFALGQGGGILFVFEAIPLAFGYWLATKSWELAKNGGETFNQFFRAQAIVTLVVVIGGLPAFLYFETFIKAGEEEVGTVINLSSAITSLVPVAAFCVAFVLMLWVKRFQRPS